MQEDAATPESAWCLIANVIAEGTKHFSPGTKVYCYPVQWGDGYEQIKVIGKHRGTPRRVTMIISYKKLTNWRAQVIYAPAIVKEIAGLWTEERAKQYAEGMRQREQRLK